MQEEVGKGLSWNTKDGVTINHRAARTLADHRHPSLSTSHLLRWVAFRAGNGAA